MHRLLLGLLALVPAGLLAQPASLSGDWQTTAHQFGATQYFLLHLDHSGDKVTGTFAGLRFECQLRATVCEAELRRGTNPPNGKLKMTVKNDAEILGEGSDEDGPFDFAARCPAAAGTPRTHQFTPTKFYNYFSSKFDPVLRLSPGDTVETKSVDAGGTDETGKRRSPGGNPLTGPFYVEGAWPGDTLVVKLNRLRLNRYTAGSGGPLSAALWPLATCRISSTTTIVPVNGRWTMRKAWRI